MKDALSGADVCFASQCKERVPRDQLMCWDHWRAVSPWITDQVVREFRKLWKGLANLWCYYAEEARAEIARLEGLEEEVAEVEVWHSRAIVLLRGFDFLYLTRVNRGDVEKGIANAKRINEVICAITLLNGGADAFSKAWNKYAPPNMQR